MEWLATIWSDVRFALRMMRKGAGFASVAILSLALGIGATTAIFSVVNALVLKPLPVEAPEQLVWVTTSHPNILHSYPMWREIRDQREIFSQALAYSPTTTFDLAGGGERGTVPGFFASGDYFSTLGVGAFLGRTLNTADDRLGAAPVCVISYGLWQRQYGKTRNVIGRTLRLDGYPFEVVGVAPAGFFGVEVGGTFDVIVPLATEPILHSRRPMQENPLAWWYRQGSVLDNPRALWLAVVARLKPGIEAGQANARLRAMGSAPFTAFFSPRHDQSQPQQRWNLVVTDVGNLSYARDLYRTTAMLMLAIVGVVLIIACANLANLLLARATNRRREVATRLALGASRWRLVRQFLTESLVLSVAGAAVGLIIARWASLLLVAALSFPEVYWFLDLSWDVRVLMFAAAMTVMSALLFGTAPALRSTRLSVYSEMKNVPGMGLGDRTSGALLIVLQVGLSMVLLVGAGLLVHTLQAFLAADLGYDPKGVLEVKTRLDGYDLPLERQQFLATELLAQFRSVPGVVSAARWASSSAGTAGARAIVETPGKAERAHASIDIFVSPEFFQTRRIPLLAGRDFGREDSSTSPAVAIISETAAHTFFGNVNPIGLTYRQVDSEGLKRKPRILVVGVAKDTKYQRPDAKPLPFAIVYRPIAQCADSCASIGTYELRCTGPLPETIERVRNAARSLDARLALDVQLMSDGVNRLYQRERVSATLAVLFGSVAVMLAMIGIYGVTSYSVARRMSEIGIRMALGARPSDVRRMIVREAVWVVLAGVLVGAIAALGAAQIIRGMLYGVTPMDPVTFVFAAFLMVSIAAVAAFLPAHRASKADPIVALRVE